MLSTKEIKNTKQASHYFLQKDNYYTREEGIHKSEWYGKGATTLQLSGEIDTEQFNALLTGLLPTGQQLGKVVEGERTHRAGWDLTFSAPKSVSILAFIGGDKRLLEAHRQAVKIALSDIERGCSQSRQKTSSGMTFQNTKNIVASLFHHDVSRAQDPQLHTHCVVFNMTQRIDSQWRSQASQLGNYGEQTQTAVNGFIERVRHHKRYYGQLYRNELAYQIKQLGYSLTVDRSTGLFEIAGIPREVLDHFSQRRHDIINQLEEQDLAGGKASALVALKTRQTKKVVDREELAYHWEQRSQSLGFDSKKLIEQSISPPEDKVISLSSPVSKEVEGAYLALKQATIDLSCFQATFTLEELVTHASGYAIQQSLRTETLLMAYQSLVSSGELIILPNDQQKTLLMAKATLDVENRLIDLLKDAKLNSLLIEHSQLELIFSQHTEWNYTQQQQLRTLFNDHSLVIVEGKATKETLIEPVIQIAQAARLSIAIISPHQLASKRLVKDIQQKPQTLWEHIKSFLRGDAIQSYSAPHFLSYFSDHDRQRTPHLFSTTAMVDLVEWASCHQAKLILFGEKDKLLPQKVGTPFHQLIIHGAKVVQLVPYQSTLSLKATPLENRLDKMIEHVVEINLKEGRWLAMANHFSRLSQEVRSHAWLVATNQKAVEELNSLTHHTLHQRQLLGKSLKTTVLIPVFMSKGKSQVATSYAVGQWVRFNHANRYLSIKRGDYLRILQVDKESNSIILERKKGKSIVWRPDKRVRLTTSSVELFAERTRELSVGEQIVLHRSLLSKKMIKGERFTIQDIKASTLILVNDQQQSFRLDLRGPYQRHVDYGYASTLHALSHERPHTLIAEMPTKSIHTHQRQLNQLLSQSEVVWFYTDNLQALSACLEKSTGDRSTVHEILEHANNIKSQVHTLYDILEKQLSKAAVNKSLSHSAIEAIDYALQNIAEREAGFTHKQVMEVAMSHALGSVDKSALMKAIRAAEKAGVILKGKREDGTLWTTLDAVNRERTILRLCQQDKGQLQPIASVPTIEDYYDSSHLNVEQTAAVKAITQSTDRVIAVQGYAGTGKTTMLQAVQSVCMANNYQLVGLAPTHTAVKELQSRGISAQTLDSFIVSTQLLIKETPSLQQLTHVLVLDEASLVSNRKMVDILQLVHQLGYRIIIVGDTRQLPAIEAGKPQALVQTQVETVSLKNIKRQHDPALKQAVRETIRYDFKAAFKTLASSIVEINEKTFPQAGVEKSKEGIRLKRIEQLVLDYFSYPKEVRDSILVITPGHDDRLIANSLIRNQLKQEGTLTGVAEVFPILISQPLTHVERFHSKSFAMGDIVRFGKSDRPDIHAGDYATVVGIHPEHRLLTLRTKDNREITWEIPLPRKGKSNSLEVFKRETRELQVGDNIRWSRTHKKEGLLSAECARVISINPHKVTLKLANHITFSFDPRESTYQHWEHGYASTVYGSQGTTKAIVLAHLESYRANLTTQPAFLVALTRAVDTFRVYTDDKMALVQLIKKNIGLKCSSLEAIDEYPLRNQAIGQDYEISRNEITASNPINARQHNKVQEKHKLYIKNEMER